MSKQKEKQLKIIEEEEARKNLDFSNAKTDLEKLRGERDYLCKENEKLKNKFVDDP